MQYCAGCIYYAIAEKTHELSIVNNQLQLTGGPRKTGRFFVAATRRRAANRIDQDLRVPQDDPFEPKHRTADRGEPKGAYQEHQLREVKKAEG